MKPVKIKITQNYSPKFGFNHKFHDIDFCRLRDLKFIGRVGFGIGFGIFLVSGFLSPGFGIFLVSGFLSPGFGIFLVSGFLSHGFGINFSLGIFMPGIRDLFKSRDFYPWDSGFF